MASDERTIWIGIASPTLGELTPPVAVNLMVTTRIANIRLEHTIGWAMVFVAAMALSLVLVMLVPVVA